MIFLDITSVALHDLALLDPEVFFYCELFQKRLPWSWGFWVAPKASAASLSRLRFSRTCVNFLWSVLPMNLSRDNHLMGFPCSLIWISFISCLHFVGSSGSAISQLKAILIVLSISTRSKLEKVSVSCYSKKTLKVLRMNYMSVFEDALEYNWFKGGDQLQRPTGPHSKRYRSLSKRQEASSHR